MAAVWVGRDATVRPREAEWSSRLTAVFGCVITKYVFKDPLGHHHYYRGALDYIIRVFCLRRITNQCSLEINHFFLGHTPSTTVF